MVIIKMKKTLGTLDLMERTSNVKIIEDNPDYLKTQIIKGSNKTFIIPNKISSDLSYLTGAIICDGHIRKDEYRIVFENVRKEIIEKFLEKMKDVFSVEEKYRIIKDKRKTRKKRYRVEISGKPIVVLFNDVFDIARGKKCYIVRVPDIIKESNLEIKRAFMEGVFDTDGGKRRRGLGLSTASEGFRDDIVSILFDLGVHAKKDKWLNKKYKKEYFGLYFKSDARVAKSGLNFFGKEA